MYVASTAIGSHYCALVGTLTVKLTNEFAVPLAGLPVAACVCHVLMTCIKAYNTRFVEMLSRGMPFTMEEAN